MERLNVLEGLAITLSSVSLIASGCALDELPLVAEQEELATILPEATFSRAEDVIATSSCAHYGLNLSWQDVPNDYLLRYEGNSAKRAAKVTASGQVSPSATIYWAQATPTRILLGSESLGTDGSALAHVDTTERGVHCIGAEILNNSAVMYVFNVQESPSVSTISTTGARETGNEIAFSADVWVDQYSKRSTEGKSPVYAWTFGDGGTSNASRPSHVYAEPGDYTVTAKVSDGTFWSNVRSKTISVTPGPGYVSPVAYVIAEFVQCTNGVPGYAIDWQVGPYGGADRFDVDVNTGTSWVSLYNGSNTSLSYYATASSNTQIRVRAGNGSGWSAFKQTSFFSPACSPGGGDTQPL